MISCYRKITKTSNNRQKSSYLTWRAITNIMYTKGPTICKINAVLNKIIVVEVPLNPEVDNLICASFQDTYQQNLQMNGTSRGAIFTLFTGGGGRSYGSCTMASSETPVRISFSVLTKGYISDIFPFCSICSLQFLWWVFMTE